MFCATTADLGGCTDSFANFKASSRSAIILGEKSPHVSGFDSSPIGKAASIPQEKRCLPPNIDKIGNTGKPLALFDSIRLLILPKYPIFGACHLFIELDPAGADRYLAA
jgi:hypothetical protein